VQSLDRRAWTETIESGGEPLAVPKKTKTRREGQPQITEAQIQAYRARRTAAPVVVEKDAESASCPQQATTINSPWGRVNEEYATIRSDLVRLVIIAAALLALIVVLSFVL
jgi:hypothetical protein